MPGSAWKRAPAPLRMTRPPRTSSESTGRASATAATADVRGRAPTGGSDSRCSSHASASGSVGHALAITREQTRDEHVDEERLAASGAGVVQQRCCRARGSKGLMSGTVSPTWRVTYVPSDPRDVAPEPQRALPQLQLSQLAAVHAGVGGRDDLAAGLLDRFGQRDCLRVGPRSRSTGGSRPRTPTPARAPRAAPGAAPLAPASPEQPPVPRLEASALTQAVACVHGHREREPPLDLHRVEQPPGLGRVRERRHADCLLEVAVYAQVEVVGATDRRVGNELPQRLRGADRLAQSRMKPSERFDPLARGTSKRALRELACASLCSISACGRTVSTCSAGSPTCCASSGSCCRRPERAPDVADQRRRPSPVSGVAARQPGPSRAGPRRG